MASQDDEGYRVRSGRDAGPLGQQQVGAGSEQDHPQRGTIAPRPNPKGSRSGAVRYVAAGGRHEGKGECRGLPLAARFHDDLAQEVPGQHQLVGLLPLELDHIEQVIRPEHDGAG